MWWIVFWNCSFIIFCIISQKKLHFLWHTLYSKALNGNNALFSSFDWFLATIIFINSVTHSGIVEESKIDSITESSTLECLNPVEYAYENRAKDFLAKNTSSYCSINLPHYALESFPVRLREYKYNWLYWEYKYNWLINNE